MGPAFLGGGVQTLCVHRPSSPSPDRQHAASSLMSLLTPSQQVLTAFINNNNNKKPKIAEQVNPDQLYHVTPLSTSLLCFMKPMDYYHVIASGHVCSHHTCGSAMQVALRDPFHWDGACCDAEGISWMTLQSRSHFSLGDSMMGQQEQQ